MTLQSTDIEVPPPFGPAVVKRGLHIRYRVQEYSYSSEAFANKDISAARWTYQLRVWESDDDTNPITGMDVTVTKGSAASTGELDYVFPCGTTVYASDVLWEIVEVDNDNADANTRTGQVEVPKVRWRQPIYDAP